MALFKRKEKKNHKKKVHKIKIHKVSENWEVYFTDTSAIRLDLGLPEERIFDDLNHTYILRVFFDHQYASGFPTKDTSAKLYKIEDEFATSWDLDRFYMVGVKTNQGAREFVFMSEVEVKWDVMCRKVMRRHKNMMYELESIFYDEGEYYNTNLYPDIYGFNWIKNHKIIKNLEAQGEKFETKRQIDFYAYFNDEANARLFEKSLNESEYDFELVEVSLSERQDYQVYFTINDIPEMGLITAISEYVVQLCEEGKGTFDGWGTTIRK